jgi:glutathione S-transferase
MVTLETSNELLFLLEDDIFTKFIILATKFLPLPPKIIILDKPNKELLSLSQTRTLPILKAGDIFFSGTLPIIKYLIKSSKDISDGINLDNRKILFGENLKEEAKVDMWLNFIFSKIYPIIKEIEMQLYGKKEFDIRNFEYAVNDLLEILVDINQYLQLKPFLTANHVQLGDIMLTSALFNCYNDIFTQNELNLIPNVIRVFKFVSNMRLFVKVFGKAIPCKKVKKPESYIENKKEENYKNKDVIDNGKNNLEENNENKKKKNKKNK